MAALGTETYCKIVVVVDDVDIFNLSDVMWAVATRARADRDLIFVHRAMGAILDPSSDPVDNTLTKVGVDATKPNDADFAQRLTIAEVFDARGNLTEPHTQRRVPLGTIQVRTYLGDRPPLGPAVQINGETLYPTSGPENRYRNILFIEKEGFDELFEAVQLAERYDLAIMSTKGMSVVAARALLDRLADQVDNVLVLHDFDVSGFSISRTLGSDSRRYIFENDMSEKIIDVGLRLEDVEELGLEAETVQVDSREARRAKLEEHGATDDEIEFLVPTDGDEECRRVELNAMTSRQLVDFVEQKLAEHGVDKVMPENGAIEGHARRLIERTLTEKAIAEMAPDIARRAADAELPKDLDHQIAAILVGHPELSWDQALAQVVATL